MNNLFVATWCVDFGDQFGKRVRGNRRLEAISRGYW
jgi:hypothetical protein